MADKSAAFHSGRGRPGAPACLVSYLSQCFRSAFSAYSREWVDLAAMQFELFRDIIVKDIRAKDQHSPSARQPGDDRMPGDDGPAAPMDDAWIVYRMETDSCIEAVVLYRIERGIFLLDPMHPALPYFARLMKMRTGAEIYYSSDIGSGFAIVHGVGTVIGPRHTIGSNFAVYQGVTLGQCRHHSPNERITVGQNCSVFAGAKILGTLTIGDDVRIAANAVLLSDADSNSTYVGAPARKVIR